MASSVPSRNCLRLLVAALLLAGACYGLVACGRARGDRPGTQPDPGGTKPGARTAVLTGRAALGDWTTDAPGVRRRITPADMPPPYQTPSVDNGPQMIARPRDAWPKVPAGFKVEEFAADLDNPRAIITAPNGDLFVAESEPGRVKLLRDTDGDGKPEQTTLFATGLRLPFGLAFFPRGPNPQYLYVGNTDSVVRFAYRSGDTKARGPAEVIVPNLPGYARLRGGGHWTRDVDFSRDSRKMYVSVGSHSNDSDDASEEHRADILEYNPDGSGFRIYAWGIRNPVGLAVHPDTGELWASVNERDGLGDDLVPDYVTHVKEGGFYGWPWYYIGPNQDPRHRGKHPELRDKVIVPDVLIQSHSASLDMVFYTGRQFPRDYTHDAFAAEHGSWNRGRRTGYKVIRVPLRSGRATGEYEDFMTGFVTPEGEVWGRPVGVTVARDGALIVSDDGGNVLWRVSYGGRRSVRKP
jgi:glucose/arabinose dehydrogenase